MEERASQPNMAQKENRGLVTVPLKTGDENRCVYSYIMSFTRVTDRKGVWTLYSVYPVYPEHLQRAETIL